MSVQLSKAEKQAFKILKLAIDPKKLLGITLAQLDPTPENKRRFLDEILWQFNAAPDATLEAVGFFDLPKFLNSRS
jgi:hypothetical protein